MKVVFADTSFCIAFCSVKDYWHGKAKKLALDNIGIAYTTEFVLLELGNHLCAPAGLEHFFRLNAMIREDPRTLVSKTASTRGAHTLGLFLGNTKAAL